MGGNGSVVHGNARVGWDMRREGRGGGERSGCDGSVLKGEYRVASGE